MPILTYVDIYIWLAVLYLDNVPIWLAVVISVGLGGLAALAVQVFFVPWQRKKVLGKFISVAYIHFLIFPTPSNLNFSKCVFCSYVRFWRWKKDTPLFHFADDMR